ncbi:MAG: CysS/YqeB C-terminal domain-containing protein [Candidatus Limnocylindria bacterium]
MTAESTPGAVVLFGSGETGAVGRAALRWLRKTGRPLRRVAVLESPAGFEPNAEAVARRWADFLRRQAEAADAEFAQLPLRRRGTSFSPDDAELARPLLGADLILLGAGSPTYTVRQLASSVAWDNTVSAHLLGASLFLASASAIAAGTCALPVYEIYKVGEDPHWKDGLRLFDAYGLALAVLTHWNNTDGGAAVDTSRCYMGRVRFAELLGMLPAGVAVLGIDEHTALAVDPAARSATVLGRGEVSVIRDGGLATFGTGKNVPLEALGPFSPADAAVPAGLAQAIRAARATEPAPPAEVRSLVASRERARAAEDWATADRLRGRIVELGWRVEDEAAGTKVRPLRR